MPKKIERKKYYVKCGQLEKWVMAFDELNAAAVTLMNAPGETMLDPYYFYVCTDYQPDVEDKYFSDNPLHKNSEKLEGVTLVQTDDVLELCNMITEEADEFYLKDMNNEDDDYGWTDDRSNEEF